MVEIVRDETVEQMLFRVAETLADTIEVQQELVREMSAHLVRLRATFPSQSTAWCLRSCEARGLEYLRQRAVPTRADRHCLPPALQSQAVRDRVAPRLTERQREVLAVLTANVGIREAGRRLGVSHVAVLKHRRKIERAVGQLPGVAAVIVGLLLGAISAPAANKTWDGGGNNNNLMTGNNWNPNGAPSANDSLFFAGTTRLTPNNNFPANTQFNGITFNNGAGAFTLGGNAMNLGGDVVNNDDSLQTITLTLALVGSSRNFNVNSSGALSISGVISQTGGTYGLTKGGSGVLILAGANSYGGATTISAGTLRLGAAGVIPDGSGKGNVVINPAAGTATLDLGGFSETINGLSSSGAGASVVDNTLGVGTYTLTVGANDQTSSFGGTIKNTSGTVALTKSGTGVLTLAGNNSYSGSTTINTGGALNIQQANALGGTSAGTTVNAGGALQLQGGITTAAEALGLNGTGVAGDGALRNISGNNTYSGAITLGSATRINSDSGLLTLNSGTALGGAFALTIGGAGNVTISSVINTGALTKDGAGVLTLAGSSANTYSGLTTVNTGQLHLNQAGGNAVAGSLVIGDGSGGANADVVKLLASDQIADAAAVTVASSGKLDLNGFNEKVATLSNSGSVDISGTLHVVNAWANGAAATVLLSGGVLTGGTFTVDGTVRGNGTIAADVNLGNGETITVNGGQLNFTALTTMAGGTIDGGPVHNSGTISGNGTLSVAVSNPGYIRASNGTLYIQALTGNQATGTLEASAGGTLVANGIQSWLNNGQVILSGGTVVGGTISNNAAKIITGQGTIASQLVNSGTLLASTAGGQLSLTGPSVENASSGVITANYQNIVVHGTFTNSGTFTMMHGVGTFKGAVVNAGAWITDPTTSIFEDTYTVTSSGYVEMMGGDVYVFSNHFLNVSTKSNEFDTLPGKFVFGNDTGITQTFAVAGINLAPTAPVGAPNSTNAIIVTPGSPIFGFTNNFALGTLEISNFSTVRVTDAFSLLGPGLDDTRTAGLYLGELLIGPDALLIISSNVQVYFLSSNNWTMANILLEGNPTFDNNISGIHQVSMIPEPGVVLLCGAGLVTLWARRQREKGKVVTHPKPE